MRAAGLLLLLVSEVAMAGPQLTDRLIDEAAHGRTATDSEAFREALKQGAAVVPELERALAAGDDNRYLVLGALRELAPPRYLAIAPARRAAIYAKGLERAKNFDDWGEPSGPSAAGRALIALGAAAIDPLVPLLDERRAAQAMDGELHSLLSAWRVRVCDYALFFILAARGEHPEFPAEPKARDRLIDALRKTLPKRK